MSTISNWIEELRAELSHLSPKLDPIFSVLEVAQAVTGAGGASAATALKVLQAALDTLGQSAAGELTHDQLVQQLANLKAEASTAFTTIEAAQDAELSAKFPAPPAGGS